MLGLNEPPLPKREKNHFGMMLVIISAVIATAVLYGTYVLTSGPK